MKAITPKAFKWLIEQSQVRAVVEWLRDDRPRSTIGKCIKDGKRLPGYGES